MKKLYIFAVIVELFGIMILSAGITYEIVMKADVGYVLISVGSLFVSGGALIFAKVAPWMYGDKNGRRQNT